MEEPQGGLDSRLSGLRGRLQRLPPGPPVQGTRGAPASHLGRGGKARRRRECDRRRPRSGQAPTCLHLPWAHPHSEIIPAPGKVFLREAWLFPAPLPPSGAPSQQQGLRRVSVTPRCEGSWGLSLDITCSRHTPRWALLAPSWGAWGGGAEGMGPPRLDSALGHLLTLLACAVHFSALRSPTGASSPQGQQLSSAWSQYHMHKQYSWGACSGLWSASRAPVLSSS